MTENNKLQTIEQQLVQEKNVSDNVLNKVRVLVVTRQFGIAK
ncbi:hypothetical protein SACIG1176_2989 [Staphylococcus aureus subsp. aureus CIG1176]|nr:hypothetical protein SACIG1176_2989 [Staphylococcus aureus subsp. aureus CIG1176]